MEDKRKRILELIEELKFPNLPEDSREHLEKLSEEELDTLIAAYEDILSYRETISDAARTADSKRFQELQDDYDKENLKLNEDYLIKMEELRKEEDTKLKEYEEKATNKMNEVVNKYEENINDIEDVSNNFNSQIDSTLSSNG